MGSTKDFKIFDFNSRSINSQFLKSVQRKNNLESFRLNFEIFKGHQTWAWPALVLKFPYIGVDSNLFGFIFFLSAEIWSFWTFVIGLNFGLLIEFLLRFSQILIKSPYHWHWPSECSLNHLVTWFVFQLRV